MVIEKRINEIEVEVADTDFVYDEYKNGFVGWVDGYKVTIDIDDLPHVYTLEGDVIVAGDNVDEIEQKIYEIKTSIIDLLKKAGFEI